MSKLIVRERENKLIDRQTDGRAETERKNIHTSIIFFNLQFSSSEFDNGIPPKTNFLQAMGVISNVERLVH